MDLHRAHQCVEALCRNGCDAVRATIIALERDLPAVGTEGLSQAERNAVLRELKAVMAVYPARRCADPGD